MDPVLASVIVGIVAGLPATIAAVAALVSTVRNSTKLEEVKRQTNGMSTILADQARAAGFEAGRGAVRRGDIEPKRPEGGRPS